MSTTFTDAEIEEAKKLVLEGVIAVKHGDKQVNYDAVARAKAIINAERKKNKTKSVGFASPGDGF